VYIYKNYGNQYIEVVYQTIVVVNIMAYLRCNNSNARSLETYFLFKKYRDVLAQSEAFQYHDHFRLWPVQKHSFRWRFTARRRRGIFAKHVLLVNVRGHVRRFDRTKFGRKPKSDVKIAREILHVEIRRSYRLQSARIESVSLI